jgi:hypothetical protein
MDMSGGGQAQQIKKPAFSGLCEGSKVFRQAKTPEALRGRLV